MSMLLSKAVKGYNLDKSTEYSENTIRAYRIVFRNLIEFVGDIPIGDVTAKQLASFIRYMQTDYKPSRSPHPHPRTLDQTLPRSLALTMNTCHNCNKEIKGAPRYCPHCRDINEAAMVSHLASVKASMDAGTATKEDQEYFAQIVKDIKENTPKRRRPIRLTGRAQISLIVFILVAIFGCITSFGTFVNNIFTSPTATLIPTRTPRPTYTPKPQNSITTSASMQTAVAQSKNKPEDCHSWQFVKPEHAGQTLCVYGTIHEVYRTNDSFTRVKFSAEPNTFFMHSTNFYYTDPDTGKEMGSGDCIQNTAPIEIYAGIPSMKINEPKKCN